MSVLYPDFLLPLLHFSPAEKHNEFTEEACLIIPSFDAQILQFQKQNFSFSEGVTAYSMGCREVRK